MSAGIPRCLKGYDLTVDMAIFRHTARRAHTQILWETVILVAHVHNHRALTLCHIFLERINSFIREFDEGIWECVRFDAGSTWKDI